MSNQDQKKLKEVVAWGAYKWPSAIAPLEYKEQVLERELSEAVTRDPEGVVPMLALMVKTLQRLDALGMSSPLEHSGEEMAVRA